MGNLLCGYRKLRKSESTSAAAGRGGSGGSVSRGPPQRSLSSSSYVVDHPFDKLSRRNPSFDYSNSEPKSTAANRPGGVSSSGSSGHDRRKKYGYTPDNFASSGSSGCDRKKKYGYIPDNFTSIDQVTVALRESGLESSNLILGIDFTKSNEWTGKVSFKNRSLHTIGDTPNPYEKAISIIGKTLAPFDEDNLIPCFGFGDATTHDQEVFSFHNDNSPCHGFEEVLACYKRIAPNLRLSGPTSYGPVVDAAVDIVERSGGQYHVLVIIADGQVTRSVNTNDAELSPQEEKTISSIVNASSISDVDAFPGPVLQDIIRYNIRSFPKKNIFISFYPLSIVLVGVGDGPWEEMKKFDDKIPAREFDNFQFVNFTAIMSKDTLSSEKETAFALAALMEIPIQYKATKEFGLLGNVTGKAKKIVPRHPPVQFTRQGGLPAREPNNASSSTQDDQNQACPVCLSNGKDMAFGCGHMTCRDCSSSLSECPICRQQIRSRLRLYT